MNEDCLRLDIWAPEEAAALPVLIWLHGGAFVSGRISASCYKASNLATIGRVIVVLVTYRLGALGWLSHPSLENDNGVSGNWGLHDQLAAIRWAMENIQQFGGDPTRITIGGQSAGALSAMCLAASPLSAGMLSGVIAHSPVLNASDTQRASAFAEALHSRTCGGDRFNIETLRSVPALDLARAVEDLSRLFGRLGDGPFPVVDHSIVVDSLVTQDIGIPTLIGTNRDEGTFFFPEKMRSQMDAAALKRAALRLAAHADPNELIEVYTDWLNSHGRGGSPGDTIAAIWTDVTFRRPVARFVESQTKAFRYVLEHESTDPDLGATHCIDVPLLFGTHALTTSLRRLCGSGRKVDRLSGDVIEAWSRFCHFGDPSSQKFAWPPVVPVAIGSIDWRPGFATDEHSSLLVRGPDMGWGSP